MSSLTSFAKTVTEVSLTWPHIYKDNPGTVGNAHRSDRRAALRSPISPSPRVICPTSLPHISRYSTKQRQDQLRPSPARGRVVTLPTSPGKHVDINQNQVQIRVLRPPTRGATPPPREGNRLIHQRGRNAPLSLNLLRLQHDSTHHISLRRPRLRSSIARETRANRNTNRVPSSRMQRPRRLPRAKERV